MNSRMPLVVVMLIMTVGVYCWMRLKQQNQVEMMDEVETGEITYRESIVEVAMLERPKNGEVNPGDVMGLAGFFGSDGFLKLKQLYQENLAIIQFQNAPFSKLVSPAWLWC